MKHLNYGLLGGFMKKIAIIFSLLFVFAFSFSDTHIPAGNVNGVWTIDGSPYIIEGQINIPGDSTLIIEPGVEVKFQGHYALMVYGYLEAVGTENDSINFTAVDTIEGWASIRFFNAPASSHLSFCIIQYGRAVGNELYYNGGGICCQNSSPIISNCNIRENYASYDGGGIACSCSNPIISNCIISGNVTGDWGCGGGIFCVYYSSPVIENCVISGNIDGNYGGGGIFCYDNSSPSLTNVTISENMTNGNSGGIYCYDSNPSLLNCILWNDSPEEIYVASGSVTATYSDIQGGWTGIGNIDADPLFADPQNEDFHLTWANFPLPDSTMSPCIDAGDPSSPLDPDGTISDMGAYYYDQGTGTENYELQISNFKLNNFPNPFNPSTIISFFTAESPEYAEIIIYNLKGQKIKTFHVILSGVEGQSSIVWDGTDDNGKNVSSGIYFYKLIMDDKIIATKKCLLLK